MKRTPVAKLEKPSISHLIAQATSRMGRLCLGEINSRGK